jgi:hypothetical protein
VLGFPSAIVDLQIPIKYSMPIVFAGKFLRAQKIGRFYQKNLSLGQIYLLFCSLYNNIEMIFYRHNISLTGNVSQGLVCA